MKLSSIKVPRLYKLWVLAFAQIWIWPQLFSNSMPAGLSVSMFFTMLICIIFNLISLINEHERKGNEY